MATCNFTFMDFDLPMVCGGFSDDVERIARDWFGYEPDEDINICDSSSVYDDLRSDA